ncbi:DUF2085 domain-containing protein (plasmid) [Halorientalis pallida]|uniref:DUF2085 domain-containing protein n=1 Tax=Halorientalis pallida TaxID=2479928 RepID=UPI003C6FEDC0
MTDLMERLFRASQIFRSYPLCHSDPSRSFCYRGRYFGLCARCTTMYLGGILTMLAYLLWEPVFQGILSLVVGGLLLVPGGVDGTTQMFGDRESTNSLRAVTGLLLGMGVVILVYGFVTMLL